MPEMKPQIKFCLLSSVFCLLLFSGCDDGLRLAPSRYQKETAEMTYDLAVKIDSEGAAAGSPATGKLVEGARANLVYTGRPASPPDPALFDSTVGRAVVDAAARPDPWAAADSLLELGIGVSALLGGVYGARAVKYLKEAREKAKALKEVVQGNELFKDSLNSNKTSVNKAFSAAQNEKQSTETKQIVAVTRVAG